MKKKPKNSRKASGKRRRQQPRRAGRRKFLAETPASPRGTLVSRLPSSSFSLNRSQRSLETPVEFFHGSSIVRGPNPTIVSPGANWESTFRRRAERRNETPQKEPSW